MPASFAVMAGLRVLAGVAARFVLGAGGVGLPALFRRQQRAHFGLQLGVHQRQLRQRLGMGFRQRPRLVGVEAVGGGEAAQFVEGLEGFLVKGPARWSAFSAAPVLRRR